MGNRRRKEEGKKGNIGHIRKKKEENGGLGSNIPFSRLCFVTGGRLGDTPIGGIN
jgi:hypothetical protein